MWTASYNREKDWGRCCSHASGFEWVNEFEEDGETANLEEESETPFEVQEVVNLLEDYDDDDDESENSNTLDPWMENALRMQADLLRMAQWILTKQNEYAGLNMGDDEAALIQSTITSFAATTASELETLRKIIPASSSDMSSHRSGIVQALLMMLQSSVTSPFGRLQKQRTRPAVHLWQNPQECKLFQPKPNENKNSSFIDLIDGDGDETREQRFLPTSAPVFNDDSFEMRYQDDERENRRVPQRPSFLENIERQEEKSDSETEDLDSRHASPLPSPVPAPLPKPQIKPYEHAKMEESNRQFEEDLQQEVAMLTVAAHNDLDSVQRMEQRMVEITTLISQFSNLVGEQQEEILQIHDSAKEAKANVNKGQESLVDATDRQKKSRHLFAWIIFGMSMTLLFFHVLRN
mmetsp:Transcript_23925/g.58471  ORF Transcript_23925/g.58471 Transcript_23925/m.58471 type:complete len:407 (-) Transcript_23925:3037-4257(-)